MARARRAPVPRARTSASTSAAGAPGSATGPRTPRSRSRPRPAPAAAPDARVRHASPRVCVPSGRRPLVPSLLPRASSVALDAPGGRDARAAGSAAPGTPTTVAAPRPRRAAARPLGRSARPASARSLVAALVAGFVWYQLGVGGASAGAAAAPRRRTTAATATSRGTATGATRHRRRRPRAGGCVVVHVAGAVAHPGVVRVRAGARVVDAIEAAGRRAARRRPRPAEPRGQGRRRPARSRSATVGAPAPVRGGHGRRGDGAGAGGERRRAPINLNTATPGAARGAARASGPSLAAAIIAERERARAASQSVDELAGRPRHRREALRRPQGPGHGVSTLGPLVRARRRWSSGSSSARRAGPAPAVASRSRRRGRAAWSRRARRARARRGSSLAVRRAACCSAARSTQRALARARACRRSPAAVERAPIGRRRGHARRRPVGPAVRRRGRSPRVEPRRRRDARRPHRAARRRAATPRARLRVLEAGDRVTAAGHARAARPASTTRYRWRHAVARARGRASCVAFAGPRSPLDRLANRPAAAVLARRRRPPGHASGRCSPGFLLGDTRAIPRRPRRRLPRRRASATCSRCRGENVAFVLALVGAAARAGCGSASRLVGGLAVLVVFGTMTRWEPSVLRAVRDGRARDGARRSSAARSPASRDPRARGDRAAASPTRSSLHSVGFLLSCGAARRHRRGSRPRSARAIPGPAAGSREALGVTARRADRRRARCCIPVFGIVPLVALPANLLAAPLVGSAHDLGARRRRRRRPASAPRRRRALARSSRRCRRCCAAVEPVARDRARRVAAGRRRPRRSCGARRRSAARPPATPPVRLTRRPTPVGSTPMPRFRLGDVVHDLTDAHPRDGHPQPHARLVLRRGARRSSSTRSSAGPSELVDEGADLLDVGGVKAGPGPEVGEAEELDRVDPVDRGARTPASTSPISGDTWRASVLDAGVRGRRGRRQRHQRLRRPRLPRRRGEARRVGRRDPHPARAPRPRSRAALRRPRRRRPGVPPRPGAARPRPPGSRPSRSRSTPGSTSARRRR